MFFIEFADRLAAVYVEGNADIKRTILRVVEGPIQGLGMQSPEVLKLVETCPKGAETLITRIIQIFTDKCAFLILLLIIIILIILLLIIIILLLLLNSSFSSYSYSSSSYS